MTFNGRTATTGVMLVLFVGASIMAASLPSKAAFMPLLFGIPGIILCLWQLILDLRRAPDTRSRSSKEVSDDSRSELEVFVWLGLFSVALIGFGFVLGGPVVVTAFVRFSSRDTWQNALFAGAGTFAVIFGVFIWLLGLPMFQGLILESLL